MSRLAHPQTRLSLVLWLVTAHSIGVGVGLIVHPPALLELLGFAPLGEPFFAVQGGVFHLVVALAYALAAQTPRRRTSLIAFIVAAKLIAAVFLVLYWLLHPHLWLVLASGIGDGLMALVIVLAVRAWRNADNDRSS